MKQFECIFIESIKNTVGYAEAKDKESFLTGASVAYYRLTEWYNKEINLLKSVNGQLSKQHDDVRKDMNELCRIIDKYQQHL